MAIGILLGAAFASAQNSQTPIYEPDDFLDQAYIEKITAQVMSMKKTGKVIEKKEIARQLITPRPGAVPLAPVHTDVHTTEEMALLARKANLRVGYLYLCPNCDSWHLNTSGGYAIAPDTLVTCDHVMEEPIDMREGYFVALTESGQIAAVSTVLARSKIMDVAILRVTGDPLPVLPLNPDVGQGAAAFCSSTPFNQPGYFSTGYINRFFWESRGHKNDLTSTESILQLRIALSTDWAPGSSGSPLLDRSGNAIAHVSSIADVGADIELPGLLTVHTGIPARCVVHLVKQMDNPKEILRIAALEPPARPAASKPSE